ncbi:MAG: hypothetical protein ACJ8DZ_02170 [Allosphingosinicella sp.]
MKRAVPAFCLAALAAGSASALPHKTQKDESYYTKQVCRSMQEIGSRLQGERKCMTQSEWDQLRMEQRRVVDHIQTNKASNGY